ncbi:hypothetical protein M9H77_18064 [Catharanthus roseus]|uniref:Uncharacterized protein n=1 Tax=Catharanthus roseus TaxID=4058 RepID=A0ACC0B6D8_CATRO|nr:hypothetical protein M9H77_18064 [Catharanthus roseus]
MALENEVQSSPSNISNLVNDDNDDLNSLLIEMYHELEKITKKNKELKNKIDSLSNENLKLVYEYYKKNEKYQQEIATEFFLTNLATEHRQNMIDPYFAMTLATKTKFHCKCESVCDRLTIKYLLLQNLPSSVTKPLPTFKNCLVKANPVHHFFLIPQKT